MNPVQKVFGSAGLITLTVSLLLPAAPRAQTRRPMAPTDILRVANVGDAQLSPNGDWVVYTLSTLEGEHTVSTLWLVHTGERPAANPPTSRQTEQRRNWNSPRNPSRPLLPAGWSATNPRWSPDGKSIAFFSTRDGQRGIWVAGPDRRVPRFVAAVRDTNFFITYDGEPFAWSPDSKMLAYISATEEIDRDPASESGKSDDPRVVDRIQYKSRTSFSDNLRTHVWVADVEAPQSRQLTSGQFYDHALSFSPRGDEIVFLSNHELNPDANNNSDIFAVNLQGQVRQITDTAGCEYEPAWSPDGKWIAYTATSRDVTTIDSVAEDAHLWVTTPTGDRRVELTEELDRRAREPRWSADSKSLFFLAGEHGRTLVYRIAPEGGKARPLFDNQVAVQDKSDDYFAFSNRLFQITSFSVAARNTPLIIVTMTTPTRPVEVWEGDYAQEIWRPLSYHNNAIAQGAALIEPEGLNFNSFDGTPIQGWLMKPIGWRPDRKYPLILSIHGGPHGMSGYAFNSAFQVYAARGYGVLYLNPRGSSGYGQKFSDGTLNEWGGGDYRDLMAGVDEALRRNSWIDSNRLGVTGGSYGGFMTNWIITQTPRFKAAVSVASVSNLISFYSTSLYQDLIHAEFGGFPWDNYDLLWQWSPLRYVKQAQTPTLFIHGEQDNDVHITQAEEMYMALRRRGVETVLLRYPREGHGLREPKHRVDALERTLAWFDRYLK
jgi:dipeptidyl aminopeptidase/acylaminoacyl peptidase